MMELPLFTLKSHRRVLAQKRPLSSLAEEENSLDIL